MSIPNTGYTTGVGPTVDLANIFVAQNSTYNTSFTLVPTIVPATGQGSGYPLSNWVINKTQPTINYPGIYLLTCNLNATSYVNTTTIFVAFGLASSTSFTSLATISFTFVLGSNSIPSLTQTVLCTIPQGIIATIFSSYNGGNNVSVSGSVNLLYLG